MAAGIGGRTVAEAKENLSLREAFQWGEYIKRKGSLHVGRRLEFMLGRITWMFNSYLGGKQPLTDFLPGYDEDEVEVDLETAMQNWR